MTTMNVMEIYRSVQGEGTLMGVPTTFVRFFACNLRCTFCDTKYSWSVREGGTWESLPIPKIAERIGAQGARHVVLTGGEPMLQRHLPELAAVLRERGHHLTVETNATIYRPELADLINLWSLSPKLKGAGTGALRLKPLRQFMDGAASGQQWKFVITGDDDLDQLHGFLSEHPVFSERQLIVIWQPEGRWAEQNYGAALEWLAERAQAERWRPFNVRVLPQMHVIIWGKRRLV
ncbi:MAG TPA: 7-carboxy-7-deazaguanine synthase QueE [Herpetosiphonaceae bacterium]